jgi:biotin operon repressor
MKETSKITEVKNEILYLIELLTLAETGQISLNEVGRRLSMSPQNVNRALQKAFQNYIRPKCTTLSNEDLTTILYKIESPSSRLLRDIFRCDSTVPIKFPDFDETNFWNVVKDTLADNYFAVVSRRVGYNIPNDLTFEQIGQELSLTRMRVNEIYRKAVEKLRQPDIINQIFNIEYLNKLSEIEEMQKELIKKCNEAYNSYTKINNCISTTGSLMNVKEPIVSDAEPVPTEEVDLTIGIDTIGFSNRTTHCLENAGYTTIGRICNASPIDILCIDKLGKTCILEILDKVDVFVTNYPKWQKLKADLSRIVKKGITY